jgi:hypothetical protein
MVCFDTCGKTRRVEAAGSLLYPRAAGTRHRLEPIAGRVKKGFRKVAWRLAGDIKVVIPGWLVQISWLSGVDVMTDIHCPQ